MHQLPNIYSKVTVRPTSALVLVLPLAMLSGVNICMLHVDPWTTDPSHLLLYCCPQADDSDDEPANSEAVAYDYLLPFLPPGMSAVGTAGSGSLTREQALSVREKALKALKDRLIERASIIQVG